MEQTLVYHRVPVSTAIGRVNSAAFEAGFGHRDGTLASGAGKDTLLVLAGITY